MTYIPEPGDVIWAWVRPVLDRGVGGRSVRLCVDSVEKHPLAGGLLWLIGTELDPAYQPIGEVSALVEPDRMWPITTDTDG